LLGRRNQPHYTIARDTSQFVIECIVLSAHRARNREDKAKFAVENLVHSFRVLLIQHHLRACVPIPYDDMQSLWSVATDSYRSMSILLP